MLVSGVSWLLSCPATQVPTLTISRNLPLSLGGHNRHQSVPRSRLPDRTMRIERGWLQIISSLGCLLPGVAADSKCRSSAQILSSPKLQILGWSLKCQSRECQSPDQNVVAQTPCYQCCWFPIYCQKGRMGLSFFFKLKRAKLISNNRYSLWTIAHTGKKCSR